MDKKIIYLISPRSASSSNPGRKISEIISVWSKSLKVSPVFGGDLKLGVGKDTNNHSFGNAKVYDNKYRDTFLWNSLSELKDIFHNLITFSYLKKNYDDNVTLVWERSSRLHSAGLMYAKNKNIPYVLEWKDNLIPYKYSLFKWYAKYIEKIKVKDSDFIVVESNVLKEMLVKKYDLNKDKIYISLNAVNSDEFINSSKLSSIGSFKNEFSIPKKIIVSYLGSFAFYHNSTLLVEASKILSKINPEIGILMVGDGKHKNECEKLAKHYELINNTIVFLPPVAKDKVPNILNSSDICVLPGSTDIICPIKIMEYMASGRATLVPNYSCNEEVIKDRETGLLFEPNNSKELASKIQILAQDDNLRSTLGLNAQLYAEKYLSWEQTWDKTLKNILNEIRN